MRKESTESRSESRPEWEQLEDWVRSQVQRLIQELLAYAEFGNDTAEAAASPRYRGAVREPAAAAVRQQDQEGC